MPKPNINYSAGTFCGIKKEETNQLCACIFN